MKISYPYFLKYNINIRNVNVQQNEIIESKSTIGKKYKTIKILMQLKEY